jgi:hypothetical protein
VNRVLERKDNKPLQFHTYSTANYSEIASQPRTFLSFGCRNHAVILSFAGLPEELLFGLWYGRLFLLSMKTILFTKFILI